MNKYNIALKKSVEKDLKKIPLNEYKKIKTKILALSHTPRPIGIRKLVNEDEKYRIRIGDYRIIYLIDDNNNKVIIFGVGHRKDIYR